MNNIAKNLKDEKNLLLLKAQSYVYKKAKICDFCLLVLIVVITIGINIATSFDIGDVWVYILYGVSVVLIFLDEGTAVYIDKTKEFAAMIQQKFDSSVFEIDFHELYDEQKINKAVIKYKDKQLLYKRSWYPREVYELDKNKAVFGCQCWNVLLTNQIGKKYFIFLLIIAFVVLVTMGVAISFNTDSVTRILLVITSIIPILSYIIPIGVEIQADNRDMNQLKDAVYDIEKQINTISDLQLSEEIQKIQSLIYFQRRKKFLIPNWFYKMHESKMKQQQEKHIANMISTFDNPI